MSETTRACLCFGAVGQSLSFNLPNTANTEIKFTKDDKYIIFKRDKNQLVTYDKPGIFIDQTFKLYNVTKWHSGDYEMEEHGLNGSLLKKVKMHLEMQGT